MSSLNQQFWACMRLVIRTALVGAVLVINYPGHLKTLKAEYSLRGTLHGRELTQVVPTKTDEPRFPDEHDIVKLDFYVAGFPKCGTTTLLKTFEAHNETFVPPKEECALDAKFSDDVARTRLSNAFNATTLDPNVKRGIKCPIGLNSRESIDRLEEWFPDTKLIFGLRHPVYYFQSYYNYRVNMVHQDKLHGPIPPAESLIGSNEWARVSTDSARFEQVLKKLGKNESTDFPPTPFKVLLYTLEQMEDDDENRRAGFRDTLGSFLELQQPIAPLKRANKNHRVGKRAFEETIDICETKNDKLRKVLVENGRETQRWIREELLQSPDVTVANTAHFNEILKQWGTDPCVKEESSSDKQ